MAWHLAQRGQVLGEGGCRSAGDADDKTRQDSTVPASPGRSVVQPSVEASIHSLEHSPSNGL